MIAASRQADDRALAMTPHAGFGTQPGGCALALATLVYCRPMTEADEQDAFCRVYSRAHAWVLERIVRLPEPERIPLRGRLGLFEMSFPETGTFAEYRAPTS